MADSQFTPEELEREEWLAIPGYEGRYEASSIGRIRRVYPAITSSLTTKVLAGSVNPDGYREVRLRPEGANKSRTHTAHSLVMLAFVGPRPDGHEINHRDTIKTNNRVQNLEYCTPKQNHQHASRCGLLPSGDRHHARARPECMARGTRSGAYTHPERVRRGSNHGMARLTEDDVRAIREAYAAGGVTYLILGQRYGVTFNMIHRIVKRLAWRHI